MYPQATSEQRRVAKTGHVDTKPASVRLRLWIDAALICMAVVFGLAIPIGSNFTAFGFRYSIPEGTGSMEPAMNSASLVIARRADPDSLHVGDIIVFTRQSDGKDIVHRIIGIRKDSASARWFTTKGDANANRDAEEVSAEHHTYKVVAIIPAGGAIGVLGCALVTITSLLALAVRLAIRIHARTNVRKRAPSLRVG